MLTHKRLALTVLAISLAVFFVFSSPAAAETDIAALRSQWNDFLHYIRMARPQLAKSYGDALLTQATPEQMYALSVESKNSQAILIRGMKLENLGETILAVRKMIDQGYVVVRSDQEEIKRTIVLLGGNLREYARASSLLVASGEYSVPQLIFKLGQEDTSAVVRERIAEVLPRIGKDAVRPLGEALKSDNNIIVRHCVIALGKIQYPHAIPQLKEVYDNTNLESLKQLTAASLVACSQGNAAVLTKAAAELYYELAQSYYNCRESVQPDSRQSIGNVWYLNDGVLVYKQVPREIFCEVYTMRMSRRALQLDANYSPAVSLWLAGYLRRELDLPEGKTDPLVDKTTPSAGDFVRASGAGYAQQVLAIGLQDANSGVMVGSIEAMRDVAGASNLVMTIDEGAMQPLVQAASNPDRRVRFLAAEVLALTLPVKQYNGSQVVVPVLADALRQSGGDRAVIIGTQGAALNTLKEELRKAGYEVIESADPLAAAADIRGKGGADLAIVMESSKVAHALNVFRADAALANLPVIALTRDRSISETDKKVLVMAPESGADEIVASLAQARALNSGKSFTPEETANMAIRAAKALELLAMSNNAVYDVTFAQKALIETLGDTRSEVQVAAANALAYQKNGTAQKAIASLALNGEVDKQIRIAAFASLTESVKRNGDQLATEHSDKIVEIVQNEADMDIRTAAAKALGALNLPSQQVKPLIMETSID